MAESPAPADPGPHARFPWGPAALCAACLAMCAWTWMRYSYAWDAGSLRRAGLTHGMAYGGHFPDGAFCCEERNGEDRWGRVDISDDSEEAHARYVFYVRDGFRLTSESVAGLVVAAMGVLVFGLYLRGYLRGRRADVA